LPGILKLRGLNLASSGVSARAYLTARNVPPKVAGFKSATNLIHQL
jgi:hypothetical protein